MTDLDALTLTLWGEARGEPIEGLIGVAMVMRNRLLDRYRGADTYLDVCTAHSQFSAWTDEKAQMAAEVPKLAWAQLPPDLRICHEVAYATIAGTLADNTLHANHYLTTALYHSDACPFWAKGISPLVTLGAHTFLSVA